MTTVTDIFTPLIGQMAWGIHRTHGSAFFMEFGRPHLQVRNPIKASADSSQMVSENLARRSVFAHGEWSLLVLYGPWEMSAFGKTCDWNTNEQEMAKVFRFMDGQKLISVHMGLDDIFFMTFDLGGELRMNLSPQALEADAWSLRQGSADIIWAYEQDGTITQEPARGGQPGEIIVTNG